MITFARLPMWLLFNLCHVVLIDPSRTVVNKRVKICSLYFETILYHYLILCILASLNNLTTQRKPFKFMYHGRIYAIRHGKFLFSILRYTIDFFSKGLGGGSNWHSNAIIKASCIILIITERCRIQRDPLLHCSYI